MAQVVDRPGGAPDPAVTQQVIQLASGYIVSAALGVAAQLRVADELAAGPRSVADLAKRAGADEDALYRLLRALAMAGVFTETSLRTFALTPAANLLRTDVPGSVRDMVVWMCDELHFRTYAELAHSIRTGETLGERVVKMPVFEYLQRNPDVAARFNNAMTNLSAGIVPAVLEAYDFSGIDVLVDVAGGHGMALASILRKHPTMRGILFDLDHVLAGAHVIDELGVADRVRKVAGDFFKSVPAGGDAYLMKHIVHDWDDEKAGVLLRNIRTALDGKKNGRLIVLDAVITPGNEPDVAKLIDLEMLVFPGGRERTREDFETLFARAGFELTRIVPTHSPVSVVEGKIR